MAAASFNECLRFLLTHEGGYSNHASDPGGPTNFGVTLADYRRHVKRGATAADVRAMRVEEAKAIYRAEYWDALRCDELPAGVDYSVFDYGVNSGIGRSGKVLRRVLGVTDKDHRVTADVLAALAKRSPSAVVDAINDERLRFLRSLKTWMVFGAGWGRRVGEVRAVSLALASSSSIGASVVAPSIAGKGQVTGRPMQKGAVGGAVIAGGATASQAQDPIAVVGIIIATVLVVFGLWFTFRWWRTRRQESPMPGTSVVSETP